MAENMRDLKRRMKSIESTEHITNAMRLVSSAKYRRAKSMYDKKSEQLQDVSATIEDILAEDEEFSEAHTPAASGGNCADSASGTAGRPGEADPAGKGKTLAIILASDRGLCGGFNTSLIKEGVSALENIPKQQVEVFCIGSRGRDFFEHSGYKVAGEYIGAPEKMSFGEIRQITEPMIEGYADGSIERILLVYTKYINSLKQEPVVRQLLPAESRAVKNGETAGGSSPAMLGVTATTASASGSAASGLGVTEIEYLPSKEEVIRYMVPKYFQLTLFQAVMESAVCEHAARRTAMENATDNARDILGNLSLTYNRVRQAAITNELIEIVSGAELQE